MMRRVIRTSATLVALVVAALLLAVGCSTAGPASEPPAASTRIDVTLTDALRIEPSPMTVPAGVPVTFVIRNAGAIDHEFFLGDEAAQAAHEQEMASMGGMMHDEPNGVGLHPGETKELTFTFAAPGSSLAGCHIPGHYPAGMKATITLTER